MTNLADQMRAIADKYPEFREELILKANDFDEATKGHFADPQTVSVPKFMGAWAKARRLYSKVTGEPLI